MKNKTFLLLSCLFLASFFGCGSKGRVVGDIAGDVAGKTATFTVGGTISNLAGTVVLQNNAKDDLTVSADGEFEFNKTLQKGSLYNVTVKTQPTGRTCIVSSGSGTIGSSNVDNVDIKCGAFYGIPDETPLTVTGSWGVLQ